MLQSERRRFHRVELQQPIRAFAGAIPVQVVDASIAGLRILHQSPLPSVGLTSRVMFQSEFGPITVDCEVVHTVEHPAGFGDPSTYQTGLRVLAADRQSQERLREMVAVFASRAARNRNEH
jgi:PilZ domain-containing protein